MIQQARAVFKIKLFEETRFAEAESGPELYRVQAVLTSDGAMKGEGVLEESRVRFSEKRSSLQGIMRFTGQVGDLKGSFVLKHSGKLIQGRVTRTHTVVPGSATGQLKGLRGEMQLESGPAQEFPVTFRYRFA